MKAKIINRGCKCFDCAGPSRGRKPYERRQFRRWLQRDARRDADQSGEGGSDG